MAATVTLRQMLIKVLTNIGEPVLAGSVPTAGNAITDAYMLQVCNFINHIKDEMEAEHQWSSRWQTYSMSYVSGNTTQQIIDSNGTFLPVGAFPNSGCQVVRTHNPKMGREVALVFDVTTFGIPFVLDEMPLPDIIYYNTILNQTPVAYSTNFTVQDLGNDVINLLMYPGANSTRNIQITLYNPQTFMDPTNGTGNQVDSWNTGVQVQSFTTPPTGTSATLAVAWPYTTGAYSTLFSDGEVRSVTYTSGLTTATWAGALTGTPIPTFQVSGIFSGGVGCDSPIIVPNRVLELGASWWALQERGETLGAGSMFSEDKYRVALDNAATKDRAMQGDLVMIIA